MRPDNMNFLDIETVPNTSMIDMLPELDVKLGNVKDPEKIKLKVDAAKSKQISSMALNPLYGRICSYVVIQDGNTKYVVENCVSDGDEKAIVSALVDECFNNHRYTKICTWNGMGFDLPYIYKRALILGVKTKVSLSYWMKRYTTTPHCDLMQIWCNWFGMEKLDTVCKAVLGEGKVEFDVTKNAEYMATGEGREKLIEYNIKDVELLKKLFVKFNGVLI